MAIASALLTLVLVGACDRSFSTIEEMPMSDHILCLGNALMIVGHLFHKLLVYPRPRNFKPAEERPATLCVVKGEYMIVVERRLDHVAADSSENFTSAKFEATAL